MIEPGNPYGRMVRHLEQLKHAIATQKVIAYVNGIGGSRVALRIPDLQGDVTCRSNPADANHLWFWHQNASLTPAGGPAEARIAAAKLLELRTKALAANSQ